MERPTSGSIDSKETPDRDPYLAAFMRGNALWPQVGFGINTFMGAELFNNPPESLERFKSGPLDSPVHIIRAMDGFHTRYGIMPVDEERFNNVVFRSRQIVVAQIAATLGMGYDTPTDSARMRRLSQLLHGSGEEVRAAAYVFGFVRQQLESPGGLDLSQAYKNTYRGGDRYSEAAQTRRNELVFETHGLLVDRWKDLGFTSTPPVAARVSKENRPYITYFYNSAALNEAKTRV